MGTREAWTDERLDDLNGRVDELSRRMDAGFARVDDRIDGLQKMMLHGFIAMTVALVTGFIGVAGLIVAQG